jgi:hypothetical protein
MARGECLPDKASGRVVDRLSEVKQEKNRAHVVGDHDEDCHEPQALDLRN